MAPYRMIVGIALLAALGGCESWDGYGYGHPSYAGGYYGGYGVGGTGARDLDPWLSDTREGQRLVLARFDRNQNGEIGRERADEANSWFRRFADKNRDGKLTDAEINWGLGRVGRVLAGR